MPRQPFCMSLRLLCGVTFWAAWPFSRAAPDGRVREPAVAGMFYPRGATELRREVRRYLDSAPEPAPGGRVVGGAVAPHAGYAYSAAVAAHTYKAIRGVPFDTLVIIGHDVRVPGTIAFLTDVDAFRTPLGDVPVDTELVRRLARAHPGIRIRDDIHAREHSVEVHLPFLQVLEKPCKIVPVLFGEANEEHCRLFAEALESEGEGREIFILASTDLSHYPTYDDAVRVDGRTAKAVEGFDPGELFAYLSAAEQAPDIRRLETPMCSPGGVGTAMAYARSRGATRARVLHRANSGDVPDGDRDRVVGYLAAVFLADDAAAAPVGDKAPGDGFSLPDGVCRELLAVAREAIRAAAAGEPEQAVPSGGDPVLARPSAVFVTLHKGGELRGCIGTTTPAEGLRDAVRLYALEAAFRDPRFPAVRPAEVDGLHIEISVLSPLRKASGADDIIPGVHGVSVRRGNRRGLFLPQVWEQLPEKERFLGALCSHKAGLPSDSWKDPGTELRIFTVFACAEPADPEGERP